jgi:hypothetical protein
MAFDFEALVGHLYVVGGRSISTAPPGTLVEVAPRKAARGREADTFFTLVLPSGDDVAAPAFYEQMASLAAERYFNTTGSVTTGLREVFTTLNQDLVEHNDSGKRHYEANLFCAVLRGEDLYLGRVGSGMALYRHGGDTQPFPPNYSSDEVLFGPPLGVRPVPDVKMASFKVMHGTRLVLADEHLADLELEPMSRALGAADIAAVLTDFKDLVTTRVTLMAVEFVPPDVPSPLPVRVAESTAKPAPSSSGLSSSPTAAATTATTEMVEAAEPNVGDRLGDATYAVSSQTRRGIGKAVMSVAGALDGINRLLERITPQPAEGQRPWLAASRLTGIVILLPVAVVVLVIGLSVLDLGQTEFELCVSEASKTAEFARGINPNDINGVLAAWNAVIIQAQTCSELRPDDPTIIALTREGQELIDRLSQVARRDTIPIETFPSGSLSKVVLQGLDLYVLDDQNELVYRVTLTSDGRDSVPNSRLPIPAMRLGAAVGEYSIGDLIDIDWSNTANSLVALDTSGVLVACSPQFLQQRCDAQRLLGSENWVNPVAITVWQERIYVLDPEANQVWRYEPAGGTYANAPTEYFEGENRPDIRAAVDFAIDTDGGVYLLFSQGAIAKYISGEAQPFSFAGFPEGQPLTSADAFFLDDNPLALRMYIISRANRTIFEISKAGTFFNSYRVFDESLFASLANVVVDGSQQFIYALSGNTVFALPRNE